MRLQVASAGFYAMDEVRSMLKEVRSDLDGWPVRYSLRQVHRNIYAELKHVHKRSNISIIIKPMHIPLSPLGSCTHGPTPTGN